MDDVETRKRTTRGRRKPKIAIFYYATLLYVDETCMNALDHVEISQVRIIQTNNMNTNRE
jgi:hypothetical protein